ncbi:hypothetical protein Q4493_00210 [Colwellia sp. 1_MG-2023]|uniref:hypothetical protein n=1 Tax=Colwellia sp. 1_MG-2023 TaxID=3062649 RepID=UPI0026E1DFFD|nr:hypothetical protein [Colwellia sp. 1_MG-2023]MDO6444186.1 hypothetical protein [Colwellia sp. 1_MG-2023]
MKLYQVQSELSEFWKDQNKKLLANDAFISERGNLFSDVLYFKHPSKGAIELNFSIFDMPLLKDENIATVTLKVGCYSLSIKEYAKLAVINSIMPRSLGALYGVYGILVHMAYFLKGQGDKSLSSNNIEAFHLSYLTENINDKGVFSRLSPMAYNGTYGNFNIINNRNSLQSQGITGVIDNGLTVRKVEAVLDCACRAVMGITLNEYKQGGSYNFLTLELGQYYVDFLRQVHDSDYFYTLVCQRALKLTWKKLELDRRKNNSLSHITKVFVQTIDGSFEPHNGKYGKTCLSTNEVNSTFKKSLFNEYKSHFEKVQSLQEENIYKVVKALGLELRFDAVEVIRILMLQKYYPIETTKVPEAVWESYLSSLNKTEIDNKSLNAVTANDVYSLMSNVLKEGMLIESAFLSSLNNWFNELVEQKAKITYRQLLREFERVSGAMTSLMVAWLGYRKSEFGFPLSAIHAQQNLDILDNSHVPFRFKLKWVVPKTNSKTKIDREITSQCYQIAAQLNELFQPPEGAPCLYTMTGSQKGTVASNESGAIIETRVRLNWEAFVRRYKPFQEIIELKKLSEPGRSNLTQQENETLIKLSSKYDLSSARAKHLLNTCEEVRKDIVRINCTGFGGKRQSKFKASLLEFHHNGCISDPEHEQIANEYLSTETKNWLRSDIINLDVKAMSDISTELLRGVRYPTPHAFRHIWAEAVLTRYQGDVGAAIRHQFCHMDNSFFMAYLRNKEASDLLKVARAKVLNSIVDNLLVENIEIGSMYLGGFSRFVSKAASLTKAITSDELRALKEHISGRVISINSSHFATCIPREGSESRAKCSEFGDVNQYNAKPTFCLGCTNALITEGNLKGIWMTVQPFVKEALQEHVMGFMIESHLPILKSGYRRLRELQNESNAESVIKILNVIERAISNIETKLAEEEVQYV